jgi:hypothetical protein
MLNHGYLAQTLRRPLPTKDGGTLRTVADAANYIVALPEDRRRTHWDRTVQLLLDMADSSEISRQLELALFLRSAAQSQNAHLNIVVSRKKSKTDESYGGRSDDHQNSASSVRRIALTDVVEYGEPH